MAELLTSTRKKTGHLRFNINGWRVLQPCDRNTAPFMLSWRSCTSGFAPAAAVCGSCISLSSALFNCQRLAATRLSRRRMNAAGSMMNCPSASTIPVPPGIVGFSDTTMSCDSSPTRRKNCRTCGVYCPLQVSYSRLCNLRGSSATVRHQFRPVWPPLLGVAGRFVSQLVYRSVNERRIRLLD